MKTMAKRRVTECQKKGSLNVRKGSLFVQKGSLFVQAFSETHAGIGFEGGQKIA
jgi:hypothetical protein